MSKLELAGVVARQQKTIKKGPEKIRASQKISEI